MKDLYIDFDGVIVDTIPALYNYLAEHGIDLVEKVGFNESQEQFEKVRKIIAGYDFEELLKRVEIINDAFNQIKQLIDTQRFNVSVLTHVNSLEEGIAKVAFINRNLAGIKIIMVPKKINKTEVVDCTDAILVDDYTGNLSIWKENGGIGILFNPDLKDKGYPVINNLNQILDIV